MNNPVLVFVFATITSLVIGPGLIDVLSRLKVRQTVRDDIPTGHKAKQGTPTMGGFLILIGTMLGMCTVIADIMSPALGSLPTKVLGVALMIVAFAALGFLDDYLITKRGKNLGLKARHKLLGQFVIAIIFVFYMYLHRDTYQTWVYCWVNDGIDLGLFYYPLAVLLIVGMSNAVNLTDGLDGLASGLTFLVSGALAIIGTSVFSVDRPVGLLAAAVSGGCLGFLWYNCNPAKIFMGDTGSLALGAGIAGIALAMKQEMMLLVLGLLFIAEALSVTIQVISYKTTGKRVFKMTPIHHHFELSGWPEQRIVSRALILQVLIVLIAISWMAG